MTEEASPQGKPRRRFTRFLLTGLATLLPVFLTGYIVLVLYRFVDQNVGRWLAWMLARILGLPGPEDPAVRAAGDILAVVIVLGLAVSAGALAASFIGRRIIRAADRLMVRLPIIKVIYPYIKQVTDFILTDKSVKFHRVVAVEYPRKGLYSLGFVTGRGFRSINRAAGQDMVQIFIPSSPTPVTGYVIFVRRDELVTLPVTIEQAFRFSVSGGVIVPPQELVQAALEAREEGKLPEPTSPEWAAGD